MTATTQLTCRCGRVRLEVSKQPIIAAECHCNSCREAGARLSALEDAADVRQPNGGTQFILYRKDRIRFPAGTELLREFRLTPASTTRRVVASCCHTPVFLEFKGGHWLSLYAALWPDELRPVPKVRTMTSDLPAGTTLDDAVPSNRRQSLSFFAGLLGAWIAMGFRVPKLNFIHGDIAMDAPGKNSAG